MHLQSLFSKKAKLGVRGRREPVQFEVKKNKRVLIHCASLGEYEQAKPIIEKCREEGLEVILSFFSPSGYEAVKSDTSVNSVIYLPLDLPRKVAKFLKQADLDLLIFVKYEFWWNFIRSPIPVVFISVSLRPDHYLFRNWASPFLEVLRSIEQLFMSDQASYDLLADKGFNNIQLSGDTRVESVLDRKQLGIQDLTISNFCGDANVIIFGSTYPTEHKEIVEFANDFSGDAKILIFPHEIDQHEIFLLKESLGKDAIIYSKWKDKPVFHGHQIMIVDQIGLLKDAYKHGSLAYVGGGFNHGIHNILEPFVYKLPLIFGPIHQKFTEANLLAKQNFARVIPEADQLGDTITSMLEVDFSTEIETSFNQIFRSGEEASKMIIAYIKTEIWKQHG